MDDGLSYKFRSADASSKLPSEPATNKASAQLVLASPSTYASAAAESLVLAFARSRNSTRHVDVLGRMSCVFECEHGNWWFILSTGMGRRISDTDTKIVIRVRLWCRRVIRRIGAGCHTIRELSLAFQIPHVTMPKRCSVHPTTEGDRAPKINESLIL